MKKYIWICSLVMLAIFIAAYVCPANCFASKQKNQQKLTDNPTLEEANKLYEKAMRWINDGDCVHEYQRAAQFYANAESYLTRTIIKLKELGRENSIDVSKEVTICEKLLDQTHSLQGAAKRASR